MEVIELKEYYLFELEANEIPVYALGEWEQTNSITSNQVIAKNNNVIGFGELENGRYVELFER